MSQLRIREQHLKYLNPESLEREKIIESKLNGKNSPWTHILKIWRFLQQSIDLSGLMASMQLPKRNLPTDDSYIPFSFTISH